MGFSITDISWPRVRISSDEWITIRHKRQQQTKGSPYDLRNDNNSDIVTVIDTKDCTNRSFELKHVKSAQMNPTIPILAISTQTKLFLMNIQTGKISGKIHFPCHVEYWCWIDSSIIGFISKNDIYHWNTADDGFQRVFRISDRLFECQITSYKSSQDGKWFSLTGLTSSSCDTVSNDSEVKTIDGVTQIFSTEYDLSNVIEAHVVNFTRHSFSNNTIASNVLITGKKISNFSGKLSVIELGPQKAGNHPIVTRSESSIWSRPDDFPIGIITVNSLQFIFVVSKFGSLYVYDLETCVAIIENHRISPDIIFHAVPETDSDGILCFARNGQVLQIFLQLDLLLLYLSQNPAKKSVAMRINLLSSFRDEVTRL